METKFTTANKVKTSNQVGLGLIRSLKAKTNIVGLIVFLFVGAVFSSCDKDADVVSEKIVSQEQASSLFPPIPDPNDAPAMLRSAVAGNCQCIDYVKNRLGISDKGSANQYGPVLEKYGYILQDISRDNLPQKYDIIIYHADYGGGVDAVNGHIGMVASSSLVGSAIRVNVVAANNGKAYKNREKTEYGCNNVSIMTSKALNVRKVSVYRR